MKFAKVLIGGIGFLIICGGILLWQGAFIPNQPSRNAYPIRGIDVSHHNGKINWAAVAAAGYRFAFIKATEGADWKDQGFEENWSEARGHGIICGAYHFFSTRSSGVQQAENFITTVPRVTSSLPPVIDIEFSRERSQMSDEEFILHLKTLSDRLTQHYGVEPIIYTTKEFHLDYLKGEAIKRLWTRSLIGRPYPQAQNWLFWQYSNRGKVNGIDGPVDLNVFRGSGKEFEELFASSLHF